MTDFCMELDLLVTVRVDDLVISGPTSNPAEGWQRIKDSGLIMEDATDPGLYPGCTRHSRSKMIKNEQKVRNISNMLSMPWSTL